MKAPTAVTDDSGDEYLMTRQEISMVRSEKGKAVCSLGLKNEDSTTVHIQRWRAPDVCREVSTNTACPACSRANTGHTGSTQ